jgi:hypothetical protein
MASKNWHIDGRYVEYCSCDHGCPCESMAEPTYGDCTGLVAFKIDKGACEDVPLDDLAFVGAFYFPRAIHHGHGVLQPIIDERATDAQREALFYILSGEDQPAGTMFQIFSVIVETIKDPIFTKIDFEWDLEKRRGKGRGPRHRAGTQRTHPQSGDGRGTPHDHRAARGLGVPRSGKRDRLRQVAGYHQVRSEQAPQLAGTRRMEPKWPSL